MSAAATVFVEAKRIEKAKLLTGFFLASEFVFFAFLILAYVDFQNSAISSGPTAAKSLHPGAMGIYTAFLLASSPTMWWAGKQFRKGNRRSFQIWLAITIIFGIVFLYGEGHEYADLVSKGVNLGTNLFGTTFFTLTGFHAFHLTIGEFLMAIIFGISKKRGLHGRKQAAAFESVSLYWHFVDGMWILIFSVVYLWSTT